MTDKDVWFEKLKVARLDALRAFAGNELEAGDAAQKWVDELERIGINQGWISGKNRSK